MSHAELGQALDRLAGRPPANHPVASAAGATIHFSSAAAWHDHAVARGVHPACELAAREVHRRMAEALGAPVLPAGTDPFVAPE